MKLKNTKKEKTRFEFVKSVSSDYLKNKNK